MEKVERLEKSQMPDAEAQQFIRMTTQPVRPLILKLAVPTIISMLVTSVYNMADTYFVSQLGKSASGAVGVVFSLMAVIQAIGFMMGMGSGSLISRLLGERKKEQAEGIASGSFYLSLLFGILLTVFGLIFIDPLMGVLGATETVLVHAREYARYILFGAPVMMGSFVLNNVLRSVGKARFSMFGLAAGGILNIILDPIFIYLFDMKIAGAAIATLISQWVSFLILLAAFLFKKGVVRISPVLISKRFKDYFDVVRIGLPSFCRQGLASISTVCLNHMAGECGGDSALSAMSIVSKVFMLIFCVGLGIGQGYQPVAGYNFGAGKWKRLRDAYRFTWVAGTLIMAVFGLLSFVVSPYLMPLFIDDSEVIAIGTAALRFQAISLPFISTNVICNMTFQSIGQKSKAVLLSCCRQGFFFLPLILLLPGFMGLTGVEISQAAADILTFFASLPFAIAFDRFLTSKMNNN